MEQPIYFLIVVSIGLTFAFSLQHPNPPPSYPVRILLLPEHSAPTLQSQQRDHNNSDNQVGPIPDGEIVARILSHMRQKVVPCKLCVKTSKNFPYESLDFLYSALATLPALLMLGMSHFAQR
jgi:hypothetical protein